MRCWTERTAEKKEMEMMVSCLTLPAFSVAYILLSSSVLYYFRCIQMLLVMCNPLQVRNSRHDKEWLCGMKVVYWSLLMAGCGCSSRYLVWMESTSVCMWRTRHRCETLWVGDTTEYTSSTAEPAASTSRCWDAKSVPGVKMETNMVIHTHKHVGTV